VRLRYLLSRFPAFLDMLLSPLSFFARLVGCPRRLLALNLLPILGNLRCTEAAHLFSYLFFTSSEKWLTAESTSASLAVLCSGHRTFLCRMFHSRLLLIT
jgi:hypothetical protein